MATLAPAPPPCTFEFTLPCGRALLFRGLSYDESRGDARGGALAASGHCTGHAQWPAGVLLSEYLATEGARLRGKTAVELGCGLGMVGLVAASFGCDVLLTDGDAAAVERARENAAAAACSGRVCCATLCWGDADADEALKREHVSSGFGFDLVLGGDLVYDSTAGDAELKQLLGTASRLLAQQPTARFLLGLQRRSVPLERLLHLAKADYQLLGRVPDGGWWLDFFDNKCEEQSDFWKLCILEFVW